MSPRVGSSGGGLIVPLFSFSVISRKLSLLQKKNTSYTKLQLIKFPTKMVLCIFVLWLACKIEKSNIISKIVHYSLPSQIREIGEKNPRVLDIVLNASLRLGLICVKSPRGWWSSSRGGVVFKGPLFSFSVISRKLSLLQKNTS